LNDSPAKVSDDITAKVERGPMTHLEAIRYLLETSKEAHYINPTLGEDRAEEALQRLGILPKEINAAKELP